MRRFGILVILLGCIVCGAWAQSGGGNQNSQGATQVYYDTFNMQWLNPAKWLTGGPGCGGPLGLECVREIQNGRLRLEVRNLGAHDSNAGFQYGQSDVYFVNPNSINSITSDVTISRFRGVGCADNPETTRVVVKLQGSFFNTGSGDAADDVTDDLFLLTDTSNPKTMQVGNWMTGSGQGVLTEIGDYPIGTPLTVTNIWDKANHQFISVVMVTGDTGQSKTVVVPYSSYYRSDTVLPAYPVKSLPVMLYSANCMGVQTFAQAEAFFDNAIINAPLPRPR